MKRLLAPMLVLLLLLCGCAATQASDTTLYAMDTAMTLRLYGDRDGTASTWLQNRINALDAALDVTDSNSDVSKLNTGAETNNADLLALTAQAVSLGERTGRRLEITILPASRLWGFSADAYRIPTAEELHAVQAFIGLSNIHLSDGSLYLEKNTELDFGALAKGYAADCCREYLQAQGISGVLSLGGNVQTVGSKAFHEPWTIGIADPDVPTSYIATLSITGSKAIVTSGDYQRYFEADGVRYCHIFDPSTASPVQSDLRSVTVVADSGVLADGLSTALFVMGLDEATAFWQSSDDFEAVFIAADGAIYATDGLSDCLTDCSFEVLSR